MDLRLPIAEGAHYKSLSQRTRVITEAWAERSVFCSACPSNRVSRSRNNTEVFDFSCPSCGARYQLKASSHPFVNKIVDAGFESMMRAIRADALPHFLIMRYETDMVSDLVLIPGFSLSSSAIEQRKPLSSNARRAGWIGCNIVTKSIPSDCRIFIVKSGLPLEPASIRDRFSQVASLTQVAPSSRGWTLDVLAGLRKIGKTIFTLKDAYSIETDMIKLHPHNKHVRDKIRQQLQVLRDLEYLHFIERGLYEFRHRTYEGS